MCAAMKSFQFVFWLRLGAGGIPCRRRMLPKSDPRVCVQGWKGLPRSCHTPSPDSLAPFSNAGNVLQSFTAQSLANFGQTSISPGPRGVVASTAALAGCGSPPPDTRSEATIVGLRVQSHKPADVPIRRSSCRLSVIAGPTLPSALNNFAIRGQNEYRRLNCNCRSLVFEVTAPKVALRGSTVAVLQLGWLVQL